MTGKEATPLYSVGALAVPTFAIGDVTCSSVTCCICKFAPASMQKYRTELQGV